MTIDLHCLEEVELDSDTWTPSAAVLRCAEAVRRASEVDGYFYIERYPIPSEVDRELVAQATAFFALPLEDKQQILFRPDDAYRGYFPVGTELTLGKRDAKEGIYFGASKVSVDAPTVTAPMQFPTRPAGFRRAVEAYMGCCETLGHKLLALIAISLELAPNHFYRHVCRVSDTPQRFAIFNYPALASLSGGASEWASGVGEHTDYGLLTILKQDSIGGLEGKDTDDAWIALPPIEDANIVIIGDMLELMTCGLLRAGLHRVRNASPSTSRHSWPYFIDPDMATPLAELPLTAAQRKTGQAARARRLAKPSARPPVAAHRYATYGDYITEKLRGQREGSKY